MYYEEITPCPALIGYIKCFWAMENLAAASPGPERILPDGCTEIVFNLADPFNQYHPNGSIERQPLSLLVGQMKRHLLIEPGGRVKLLGVRFRPGGVYPFLGFPQDEIAGAVIDLSAAWTAPAREIELRLDDAAAPAENVKRIEAVLSARLNRFRTHDDKILKAVDLILRSGGSLSIQSLAEDMGINSRSLDRQFNTQVGLSPKALSRIIRFQRVFKMIEGSTGSPDWVRIALDCGYYDQPHFIREFRAIAGQEPTSYFSAPNVMSGHFTQS